jgi:hypothetical protein
MALICGHWFSPPGKAPGEVRGVHDAEAPANLARLYHLGPAAYRPGTVLPPRHWVEWDREFKLSSCWES